MLMREKFHLLMGSLGDDSHSVGMCLLETAFREFGFYVKNIGIMNVLEDFYNKGIKKRRVHRLIPDETIHIPSPDVIDDQSLSDQEFYSEREKVLESCSTGQEVWNADIKKNHSDAFKNMHNAILNHQASNCRPLIQPRTGVAHTCDEIEILTFLRQKGLDISSIQLDAASRKNMYDKAREGVLRTEKGKTSCEFGRTTISGGH